jgi:hypothetical protein
MPRPKSPAALRRERLSAAVSSLERLFEYGALWGATDQAALFEAAAAEIRSRRAGLEPEKREELLARLNDLSCGDGGCRVGLTQGMHTNGGCRCVPLHEQWSQETRIRVLTALSLWRDLAMRPELSPTDTESEEP